MSHIILIELSIPNISVVVVIYKDLTLTL